MVQKLTPGGAGGRLLQEVLGGVQQGGARAELPLSTATTRRSTGARLAECTASSRTPGRGFPSVPLPGNVGLQRQAGDAWVAADALSEVAGVAYFDRHGVRRHAETDHTFMVTLVLQAYAARKGLVYDRRTE